MTTVGAADGFALAVQTGGPPVAPPLLLLPGQANSHRWWDGLREVFEPVFRTITFDYRGTGDSRGEVGEWGTSLFAADAAAVLVHLGYDEACVFGTSMGGRVAQKLAIEHPQRVSALAIGCSAPGGEHAVARDPAVTRAMGHGDVRQRLRFLFELFYTPAWPHPLEESTLLGDPSMTRAEKTAHRRGSLAHDAWGELPRIAASTLVIHGEDDVMTPAANARLLAERIPGARLELFPGRHGFFSEYADEVLPRVREFLATTGVDGGP
ncbi:alpha/beta fold hydrolase [Brevibacterium sp. 5221]|uniref:Alpha/beta fold hydrolase n=1 Tax=Brevibacterium rongguiense TaxID=2695267 RepID=A0A6N9H5H7_9MICO|nr:MULTISPECIES: alpha/beta hydrolase [Brevibacterium]MYM19317.1 alpha/beta fold hydrolase [Brevibacterium rongguiense]WAL39501.1 alpha/beta hydrolase [Brevibacterium sp. BRM-1]